MKRICLTIFAILSFMCVNAQNTQISPEMKLAFLKCHKMLGGSDNSVTGEFLQSKVDEMTTSDKSLLPYKEYLTFSYNGLYYDKFVNIMPKLLKYNGAPCLFFSNLIAKEQYNPDYTNENMIVDDIYENVIINAMNYLADAGNNGIKRPQYVCVPVSTLLKGSSDYIGKTYEFIYLASRIDAKKLKDMSITAKDFKKKLKIFISKDDGSLKRIQ